MEAPKKLSISNSKIRCAPFHVKRPDGSNHSDHASSIVIPPKYIFQAPMRCVWLVCDHECKPKIAKIKLQHI